MPRPKPEQPYHRLLLNLSPGDLALLDDLVADDQRATTETASRADAVRRLIRNARHKDRRIVELTQGLERLAARLAETESKLSSAENEVAHLEGEVRFLKRQR